MIARFGPEDGDTLVTDIPNLNAQHCAVSEGFLSPEYKEAGQLFIFCLLIIKFSNF